MKKEQIQNVYYSRPFKTRNADEYELDNILDLFIDPTEGLIGPFEYSNSIIKGKMGTGKTMYLRANYAYYLYTLVPSLIECSPIVLPVYIKLSDFQNLRNAEKIYDALLIKIIEEIIGVTTHLKSAEEMSRLHIGAQTLPGLWSIDDNSTKILSELQKLTAEEYVESVTSNYSIEGSATAKFINGCAKYEKESFSQLKQKKRPAFQNLKDVYDRLIAPFDGRLLLLFDEIGSTSKDFFKDEDGNDSYFKTLMNQLRTLSFVRTKIAVYPHSNSDILNETRYGDVVELECDLDNETLYNNFIEKTVSLIERYIEKSFGEHVEIEELYDIEAENQIIIEQIINATKGNMRRMVHLLDSSMDIAYRRNSGKGKINIADIEEALKKQGAEMESRFEEIDRNFLTNLAKLCKSRSTFRFTFSNRTTYINKFTSLSAEYNIINISQAGQGRAKTVYEFDYAYCMYRELPTHYIIGTEKIDKDRSRKKGIPIKRIAQLSDELMLQSSIEGKWEGVITYVGEDGKTGFVKVEENSNCYILMENVVKSDQCEGFRLGQKIRFIPLEIDEKLKIGVQIELLN